MQKTPCSFIARMLERLERFIGLYVIFIVSQYRNSDCVPHDVDKRCVIRVIQNDELHQIAADQSWDIETRFLSETTELDGGCLGADMEGQLVGYSWYAYDTARFTRDVFVLFPGHVVYRYKMFVKPEFRGQRIASVLIHRGDEMIRTPDRNNSFALVAAHNEPSLSAFRAAGRQPTGVIVFLRTDRLFLAWHSPAARRLGIRLERKRCC